jgi:hypothetical protein
MGQMKVANFNVLGKEHKLWTRVKVHEPHPRCFTALTKLKSEKHICKNSNIQYCHANERGQLVQTPQTECRGDWKEDLRSFERNEI